MAKKETKIETKEIYNGKVVKLRVDKIAIEGKDDISYREVIHHNGGCSALIKTKDDKIIFVHQFRYAYNDFTLELPAGKCEIGEKPIETIAREVSEEVGIIPLHIEEMGYMYPSPGYTDEVIHLFYIDEYQECSTHFDDDEDLDRYEYNYDEVMEMINNGKIVDAKTLILIYKCQNKFKNN